MNAIFYGRFLIIKRGDYMKNIFLFSLVVLSIYIFLTDRQSGATTDNPSLEKATFAAGFLGIILNFSKCQNAPFLALFQAMIN